MRIEEYQQVEDIIYNKYPSGIDSMLLGNILFIKIQHFLFKSHIKNKKK